MRQITLVFTLAVAAILSLPARGAATTVTPAAAIKPVADASVTDAPGAKVSTAVVGERQFNDCLRLPKEHPVRVTLRPESEILDVILWISSATCKGFITAGGLQLQGRKVTVLSPEELSAGEAYRLFLALLDSVQLTVEPFGRFLRVIEASKSPRALLPVYGSDEAPPSSSGDAFVTRLVRLRHAAAADIVTILQGYRSEAGSVMAYPPAGTLIITDRAAIIERLVVLIVALDVPGEQLRLWTLPVRHISAVDLAQTLAELAAVPMSVVSSGRKGATTSVSQPSSVAPLVPAAGATAPPGGVARMVPDDRAGRLLVVATEAAFARLAGLAARLDIPAETRATKVHAYRCRHADCEAVASILGTLTGIAVSRGPAASTTRARTAKPSAGPVSAAGASGMVAAGAPMFAGDVRVTSDPSTNALLVMSSLEDFRALRRLIDEIDVARKQVYVEATIMEVVRRKTRRVGVSYSGGRALGDKGSVIGGFNAGKTLLLNESTLGSALVGLSGLAVGAPLDGVAAALGLPTGSVPSLGAFIQLLQQDENVDLLANPSLLITNNDEGEISVGQVVPVQGAFTGTVNGSAISGLVPSVSVNREKVALTLKLIPHVNDEGLIRLEIDQEMSELGAESALGPSTTQRTARTTVFARDQQTIVIGGLTRDRQADSVEKVPVLGDIPLIGVLFRSTVKSTEKQNIILALTPYVIDGPADLTRVLEAKLRDRREFVRLYGTDEERRLLIGPLGTPHTPGMLERINRAVRALDDQNAAKEGEGHGEKNPENTVDATGVPL